MPKLAETAEVALAWELETGAEQAYRVARERGDSELTAFNAAADAALALGCPVDRINDSLRALIDWAMRHGRE